MCGFVGAFDATGNQQHLNFDLPMAAKHIVHRGPDMSSVASEQYSQVVFNRLSINDLQETGLQPFEYQGIRAYVNGEIYNHKALKQEHCGDLPLTSGSDCEIIPYLYAQYGVEFASMLNGMFAIVIIDEPRKKLYLFRDRFGVKPVYFSFADSAVLFASEMKALTALPVGLTASTDNIRMALSSVDVVAPYSLFDQVRQLMPGHYLCVDASGQEQTQQRWYQPQIGHVAVDGEFRQRFFELFDSAVALRLDCDVPVGAFLSGGLDSTLNCMRMHHLGYQGFPVFNAVIEDKATHAPDHDNINAKRLAQDLGLEYHGVPITREHYFNHIVRYAAAHDEILLNTGDYIFYAIAEQAKPHVTVMMDGMGADELFGGYPWQSKIKKWSGAKLQSPWFNQGLFQTLWNINPRIARFYRYAGSRALSHAHSLCSISQLPVPLLKATEQRLLASYQTYLDDIQHDFSQDPDNLVDYLNYLLVVPYQCLKTDRGTMFSGIESRSPFLDYRVVDFMFSVAAKDKGVPGSKALERHLMQEIAPDYILDSPKTGPTFPVDYWFKKDPQFLRQLVDYFLRNKSVFAQYLPDAMAHLGSREALQALPGIELHALLALLIWHRKRFEQPDWDTSISLTELIANAEA